MRGRKPKPAHLKLVTGNPGKRPLDLGQPRPRRELLTPPAMLSAAAKAEWRRVAPELHRIGLLTVADRLALAGYCQSAGRWEETEQEIAALAASGEHVPAGLIEVSRRALRDAMRGAEVFGMTPASRSRLRGAPSADQTNPFENFENAKTA